MLHEEVGEQGKQLGSLCGFSFFTIHAFIKIQLYKSNHPGVKVKSFFHLFQMKDMVRLHWFLVETIFMGVSAVRDGV